MKHCPTCNCGQSVTLEYPWGRCFTCGEMLPPPTQAAHQCPPRLQLTVDANAQPLENTWNFYQF